MTEPLTPEEEAVLRSDIATSRGTVRGWNTNAARRLLATLDADRAGLDVDRLAEAMDNVDVPVTGDEMDDEDRAEHRAYAAELAREYAALTPEPREDAS